MPVPTRPRPMKRNNQKTSPLLRPERSRPVWGIRTCDVPTEVGAGKVGGGVGVRISSVGVVVVGGSVGVGGCVVAGGWVVSGGTVVAGASVVGGVSVTGVSVTGVSVTGVSVTGVSVTGVSVTGVSVTGGSVGPV